MSLAKRLREARELRGLKPAEVARHFKISDQAVHQWENERAKKGRPSLERLLPLARLYNTTTDWLLGAEGPARAAYDLDWILDTARKHTLDLTPKTRQAEAERTIRSFLKQIKNVMDSEALAVGEPENDGGKPSK